MICKNSNCNFNYHCFKRVKEKGVEFIPPCIRLKEKGAEKNDCRKSKDNRTKRV